MLQSNTYRVSICGAKENNISGCRDPVRYTGFMLDPFFKTIHRLKKESDSISYELDRGIRCP